VAEQEDAAQQAAMVVTPTQEPAKRGRRKLSEELKPRPMPTDSAASKLLKARDEAAKAKELEREKSENESSVFYLKCPRVENHIAAFLTSNVRGRITPSDWEHVQHKPGDPWKYPFIACQECTGEREARPWMVHLRAIPRVDGSFDFVVSGERRHSIGSMPRAEVDAQSERIASMFGMTANKTEESK
jgi:hypothetical protein